MLLGYRASRQSGLCVYIEVCVRGSLYSLTPTCYTHTHTHTCTHTRTHTYTHAGTHTLCHEVDRIALAALLGAHPHGIGEPRQLLAQVCDVLLQLLNGDAGFVQVGAVAAGSEGAEGREVAAVRAHGFAEEDTAVGGSE